MQEYRVSLDCFEGPLDLLLHLIEKRELDITAVSLALVTDQYLEYLSTAEPDLDALADFLVVASKLLVIKSLALFPQPVSDPEPEEIASDLTQRLIEYRAFKRAAEKLRALEESGQRSHPRIVASRPTLSPPLPEGIGLTDLVQALQRALSRPSAQPADVVIPRQNFSIAEKAKSILAETSRGHAVNLNHLLRQACCRAEAVAIFLAALELLKRCSIEVIQERLFADIVLLPRPHGDGQESDNSPEAIDEYVGDGRVAAGSETLMELVESGVADGYG